MFPEGYKPQDWNEVFGVALPKIKEQVLKEIEQTNEKRRDQLSKINEEFDQELESIASKDPNVPKKGTQEREDWEQEIASVGTKYKLHTMTDAYDVWKALNTSTTVGAEASTVIQNEGRPATQVAPASHVGRGYGTGTVSHKTVYKVGGGRRLDDILEQRMKEEGIES